MTVAVPKNGKTRARRQKLTDQHRLFAAQYSVDGNGTRAAKMAGCSPNAAAVTAHQWLNPERYPLISQEIQKCIEAKRRKCEIRGGEIIAELACAGFLNPKHLLDHNGVPVPIQDLADEVARAIKKFKISYTTSLRKGDDGEVEEVQIKNVDIEFYSKLEALRTISELLGLLKVGNTNVNILAINWDDLLKLKESGGVSGNEQGGQGSNGMTPAEQIEAKIQGVLKSAVEQAKQGGELEHLGESEEGSILASEDTVEGKLRDDR